MMDSTQGPDNTSDRINIPASSTVNAPIFVGSVAPPTATPAPPNRSLSSRLHRSRRGFASGKSRLSLKIDDDCTSNGDGPSVTEQSTPASTSSSCSSDVVPWWEVEYQCPPPGHLGAHVVPVSAEEQAETTSDNTPSSSTTRSADINELSTPTQTNSTSTPQKTNVIRLGMMVYETPERARRGPRNKLTAIRSSIPCLLVDSSPSQKRKMRSQDPTDSGADLFSSKEFKRFHAASCSSLKKSALPSRVVTPSTLVQPLTQIGISQTLRVKPRPATEKHTETPAP